MKRRLIFCRTPLQSLVAAQIQRVNPAFDTLIYKPTSSSLKHRHYFDDFKAVEKVFCEFRPEHWSHTFSEVRSLFDIPLSIRSSHFDEYLVASFDSLTFALLTRGGGRTIDTFDDGVLNVLPSEMRPRIQGEHKLHRWIKHIAGARNNRQTVAESRCHYSIFEISKSYSGWRNVVEIDLFGADWRAPAGSKVPLTLFLGTCLPGFAGNSGLAAKPIYERVAAAPFDIFIPHPADAAEPRVSARVPLRDSIRRLIDIKIAEEIIIHLYRTGHDLTVYGVASTTLLNVARYVRTVNILVPALNESEAALFESFGVQSLPAARVCEHIRR